MIIKTIEYSDVNLFISNSTNMNGGADPEQVDLAPRKVSKADVVAFLDSLGIDHSKLRYNEAKNEWICNPGFENIDVVPSQDQIDILYKGSKLNVELEVIGMSNETIAKSKLKGGGVSDVFKVVLKEIPVVLFVFKIPPSSDDEIDKIALLEKRVGSRKSVCGLIEYLVKNGIILLDYKDGTLADFNAKKLGEDKLPLQVCLGIVIQFVKSLLCLKELRLAYIDIKPENVYYVVLLNRKIQVYLGDIGSLCDLENIEPSYIEKQLRRLAVNPGASFLYNSKVCGTDHLMRTGIAQLLMKLTCNVHPTSIFSKNAMRVIDYQVKRLGSAPQSVIDQQTNMHLGYNIIEPIKDYAKKSDVPEELTEILLDLATDKDATLQDAYDQLLAYTETLESE